jgi:hypothetical protein
MGGIETESDDQREKNPPSFRSCVVGETSRKQPEFRRTAGGDGDRAMS